MFIFAFRVLICAKRKQWEGCMKFLGYGIVGLAFVLVKEL